MTDKILIITPKFPIPANDGSKIANLSLLRCLASMGFQIDLIAFSRQPVEQRNIERLLSELKLSRVTVLNRQLHSFKLIRIIYLIFSFLSMNRLAFTYLPFRLSRSEQRIFNEFKTDWKYIIFDGLHSCSAFLQENFKDKLFNAKLIYRSHNFESELWIQQSQKANFLSKFIYKNQIKKIKDFEKLVLKTIDILWAISERDLNNLLNFTSIKSAIVIPVAFEFQTKSKIKTAPDSLNLLFIGDINWKPNRDGILWFLQNVWAEAASKNSKLNLNIVGKDSERYLSSYKQLRNIAIHDYIEDLNKIYQKTDCCIIPVFTGSGVRIKAIEAACYSVPVISTETGISGLNLLQDTDYIRANNAQEWIDVLSDLTHEKCLQIGSAIHQQLKSQMDQDIVCEKIRLALRPD